jgi:hypothetical protein
VKGGVDVESPADFQVPINLDLGNDSGEYPEFDLYRNVSDPEGKLRMGLYINNAYIDTEPVFDVESWYFVVVCYDGSALTLEVDRTAVGTDLTAPNIVTAGNDIVFETSDHGEVAPTGSMDACGIYLEVLSEAYKDQLFNSGSGWSPY